MELASIDHLLNTTRSVRKRLDFTRPVEPKVIERCIEIAMQSPTGSNQQGWHFVVVTDPEKRAGLGEMYRRGFETYQNARKTFGLASSRMTRASPRHSALSSQPITWRAACTKHRC